MRRKFRVKVGDKVFEVEVEEVSGEPSLPVSPTPPPRIERAPPSAPPSAAPSTPKTEPAKPVETAGETGVVRAPLPGNVVEVKCREGDRVNQGDPLLVLESMKMENVIYSPKSGVVKRVAVSKGASVQFGDILMEIE